MTKTTKQSFVLGSSANEQRAKEFSLEQARLVKRKSVDPFNASEQDSPGWPQNVRFSGGPDKGEGKYAHLPNF